MSDAVVLQLIDTTHGAIVVHMRGACFQRRYYSMSLLRGGEGYLLVGPTVAKKQTSKMDIHVENQLPPPCKQASFFSRVCGPVWCELLPLLARISLLEQISVTTR